jgi:FtsP/CotA-like multicopper oxidase with cupredoxin domain
MKIRTSFAALALLAAPLAAGSAAYAHGSMKPQHGGIVQMTGETLFELVASPKGVELYVSEDDEPIASSSATAKLSIASGAAKKDAALTPAGGNKFVGEGLEVASGSKVTVTLVNNATKAKSFATFTIK